MSSGLPQIGFLLFVSALVAMLMRRLRLPYTVGLVLAGMALYLVHVRLELHLTKDLIFSIFLPPLVFEAALSIRWTDLKRDLPCGYTARNIGSSARGRSDGRRHALCAGLELGQRHPVRRINRSHRSSISRCNIQGSRGTG